MPRRNVTVEAAQLEAAKNQVRGSARPSAAISKARLKVPASKMQAFIDWLPTVKRNGQGISFGHFPNSIDELWQLETLAKVSLVREVAWASCVIRRNAEKLTAFRAMASRYETHLVQSHFAECRDLLDEIETQFGISLWSIETRLALLQLSEGLEAQKAYAMKVLKARGHNDIVAFLTYNVSRRNEPNTTPLRYIHQLEESVSRWREAGDLASYVLFHTTNRHPICADDYANVLRHEASSALVDQYDTFVRLAICAAVLGYAQTVIAFRNEILQVAEQVDDDRIRRAAFLTSGDRHWLDRSAVGDTGAEDALLIGDYTLAASLADTELKAEPLDTAPWFVKARAAAGAQGCSTL